MHAIMVVVAAGVPRTTSFIPEVYYNHHPSQSTKCVLHLYHIRQLHSGYSLPSPPPSTNAFTIYTIYALHIPTRPTTHNHHMHTPFTPRLEYTPRLPLPSQLSTLALYNTLTPTIHNICTSFTHHHLLHIYLRPTCTIPSTWNPSPSLTP